MVWRVHGGSKVSTKAGGVTDMVLWGDAKPQTSLAGVGNSEAIKASSELIEANEEATTSTDANSAIITTNTDDMPLQAMNADWACALESSFPPVTSSESSLLFQEWQFLLRTK